MRRTIHIATGIIIGAGTILGLLLGIIAWLVDKGFDRLVELLTTK
jgi:ABC-type dipeptide/oligopeptide/nickel transport system permease subunit